MKAFESASEIIEKMRALGATRIYCKFLAENDNSKQQIYLGRNFDVLKLLPFGNVETSADLQRPNFKARMQLFWIDASGAVQNASGAQLILYPDYPEVRLSGFLRGCRLAPAEYMRPVPKAQRRSKNEWDGRVLILGAAHGMTFAYLALPNSKLSVALSSTFFAPETEVSDVLRTIYPPSLVEQGRDVLLSKLRTIHAKEWLPSTRLNRDGFSLPYTAPNGGGYTLEAQFGVVPNGTCGPDFQGWELKAHSGSRITLMTPEPDGGYYGLNGTEAFLRKYGRLRTDDTLYFTGVHRVGKNARSGHKLFLKGFDSAENKIVDVEGGIQLIDPAGQIAAEWSFRSLIEKWGRKHAATVYVPYERSNDQPPRYRYVSPVYLGQGTDFNLLLVALAAGQAMYDPAPKLSNASSGKPKVKARSQFRITLRDLGCLYHRFEKVDL